jgi:hypothetical protein
MSFVHKPIESGNSARPKFDRFKKVTRPDTKVHLAHSDTGRSRDHPSFFANGQRSSVSRSLPILDTMSRRRTGYSAEHPAWATKYWVALLDGDEAMNDQQTKV